MATSGTVSTTQITVATIIDHAMRRCGLSTSQITPDLYNAASENLYFYLSALSNDGINLWTVQKTVIGLLPNQNIYYLPVGTIDIQQISYRNLTLPSSGVASSSSGGLPDNAFDQDISTACTQTATNGNISYDFGSGNAPVITTVGLLANGDTTLSLVWEYSTDSITWNTVYTSPLNVIYLDRQWTYYEVSAPAAARYFRMREVNNGTINVREVIFGCNPQDITLGRMNNDMYANLVNKYSTGPQPLQFWFDRQAEQQRIWVWPTPSSAFVQLVIWHDMHIQDVGSLSDTLAIPQRWIDAIVSGLAARLCLEIPESLTTSLKVPSASARYQMLQAIADRAIQRAADEERDNSPIMLSPNISVYTR